MSKVTVRGVSYEIPEKLTLGETCDVESVAGADGTTDAGRLRRTAAMVWISMRRRDASVTWQQVRDFDWDEVEFETDKPQEDEAVPPARTAAQDDPVGVAV